MSGADTRLLVQWTTTFTSEILVCINLIINPRLNLFLGISLTTDRGIKNLYHCKGNTSFSRDQHFAHFFPTFRTNP